MADLAQLSIATSEALRDAEAKGAAIAAHFLRVQIHELFREARHVRAPEPKEPLTREGK